MPINMKPTKGQPKVYPVTSHWKRWTHLQDARKSEDLGLRAVRAYRRYASRNGLLYEEPQNPLEVWGFEGVQYVVVRGAKGPVSIIRQTPGGRMTCLPLEQMPESFQKFIANLKR